MSQKVSVWVNGEKYLLLDLSYYTHSEVPCILVFVTFHGVVRRACKEKEAEQANELNFALYSN